MKWLIGSFVFAASLLFTGNSVLAAQSQLIITEVRLGGGDVSYDNVAYKQYVRIHNPTSQSVALQDWKVQYAKTSFAGQCQDTTWSSEGALSASIEPYATHIVVMQLTDAAAGSVRIVDAANVVHDTVGWGDAPCSEGGPVNPTPDNGKSLVRYTTCDGSYIGADTNDNRADFISNQEAFALVEAPECTPTCLDSQQLIDGVCVDDQCTNLAGFQQTVPDGYTQDGFVCERTLLPLVINEVYPNAKGSDEGEEYIELYNPNDSELMLEGYRLRIGDASKEFLFPADAFITAKGYAAFRDSDLGFTLTNTRSKVALLAVNGDIVSETPYYELAKEGEAWALIDGIWRYTNRPTFNAANSASEQIEEPQEEVSVADLKPCAANQYRNEETNRCRLLASTTSELTPCKEGQVRNEETNRCRATVAIAGGLTPCKEGQYRSEETNRCRSIATDASTLTPCKAGQERNPETNRCRNATQQAATDIAFAPEPVKQDPAAFAGWWAVGGIGALAVGRLGWEWREEIVKGIRAIGSFLTPGK